MTESNPAHLDHHERKTELQSPVFFHALKRPGQPPQAPISHAANHPPPAEKPRDRPHGEPHSTPAKTFEIAPISPAIFTLYIHHAAHETRSKRHTDREKAPRILDSIEATENRQHKPIAYSQTIKVCYSLPILYTINQLLPTC